MLKKLTDRVYHMPHDVEADKPHLGLICGSKYSLIVDSGNSPEHARQFMREVEVLGVAPVKYLVLTHWHWDHVFGIKDMKVTTIAHSDTKAKIQELQGMKWDDKALDEYVKKGVFNEFTIGCIKSGIPDRSSFSIGDLDMMFEERLEIDLGGVTCIIEHVGGDHTPDSSIVYIPEEKVMFLGDCVYGSRYNGVYGYTGEKLYPMLEKIRRYEAEHYIISHAEVASKADIEDFWKQLTRSEQAARNRQSIEEAQKAYVEKYGEEPVEDEMSYMKWFVDVNNALAAK